jgi:hypothetical protein
MSKDHDVWLMVVQVRVLGRNRANLAVGSSAFVHCFIPEHVLEAAIPATDNLLSADGMKRTDVLSCRRYDAADELDDDVPDFLKKDIIGCRTHGEPLIGTTIISKESASFEKLS